MMETSKFRILQGDVIAMLKTLPSESVNCCVTSPPYWGLRSYETELQVWGGDPECQHEWAGVERHRSLGGPQVPQSKWQACESVAAAQQDTLSEFCEICGAWRGELGLEPSPDLFIEHLVSVFREVRRVLRSDGTLWLNIGDCFATGAGAVGKCPGGGAQGARWAGRQGKDCDPKRGASAAGQPLGHPIGYRGFHADDPKWAGQHPGRMKQNGLRTNSGAAIGPMIQPNRMPQAGLKPKDLVGIPWMLAFALRADGWWLRMDNVWSKRNCMPESVTDRPTKSHEYVFLLSKSERYYYDADAIMEPLTTAEGENYPARARITGRGNQAAAMARGNDRGKSGGFPPSWKGSRFDTDNHQGTSIPWEGNCRNKRSVWEIGTKPFRGAHFAVMPEELAQIGVLAGAPLGGIVLDPFCGSGTVGVVALRHGRQFLGIELNPKYWRMAHRRIIRSAPLTVPACDVVIDEPHSELPLFGEATA